MRTFILLLCLLLNTTLSSCQTLDEKVDTVLKTYSETLLNSLSLQSEKDFKQHFSNNDKYANAEYISSLRSKFERANLMDWEKLKPVGYIKIPSGQDEFEFDIIGKDTSNNFYTFHFVKVKINNGQNMYKISSDDVNFFGNNIDKLIDEYTEDDWQIVWY